MGLMTTLGGFWKSLVSRQLHVTLTISFVYTIVKLTCLVLSLAQACPTITQEQKDFLNWVLVIPFEKKILEDTHHLRHSPRFLWRAHSNSQSPDNSILFPKFVSVFIHQFLTKKYF